LNNSLASTPTIEQQIARLRFDFCHLSQSYPINVVFVDDANDILKIIEIKKDCKITNLTIIGGVESWIVKF
jgi:PII-like signaling protein